MLQSGVADAPLGRSLPSGYPRSLAPADPPSTAAPTSGNRCRLHDDVARDDVDLELVDLALQLLRDRTVEVVERREHDAPVLQGPDVGVPAEGAVNGLGEDVEDGRGDLLEDRGQRHVGVLLSLIHISEPTRRTPISYAVFCLKKKDD